MALIFLQAATLAARRAVQVGNQPDSHVVSEKVVRFSRKSATYPRPESRVPGVKGAQLTKVLALRGITADRGSSFRCGIVRERSKKARESPTILLSSHEDLRHLSSSEGVAMALQMPTELPTPRSLSCGRTPTTLQAEEQHLKVFS